MGKTTEHKAYLTIKRRVISGNLRNHFRNVGKSKNPVKPSSVRDVCAHFLTAAHQQALRQAGQAASLAAAAPGPHRRAHEQRWGPRTPRCAPLTPGDLPTAIVLRLPRRSAQPGGCFWNSRTLPSPLPRRRLWRASHRSLPNSGTGPISEMRRDGETRSSPRPHPRVPNERFPRFIQRPQTGLPPP